jgi:hypothetical protein
MLPFLVLLPAGVSLIFGIVYVFHSDGHPAIKVGGSVVFVAAVYLQFYSSQSLFGLLLQIVLAITLALWRKVEGST